MGYVFPSLQPHHVAGVKVATPTLEPAAQENEVAAVVVGQ